MLTKSLMQKEISSVQVALKRLKIRRREFRYFSYRQSVGSGGDGIDQPGQETLFTRGVRI
jgi:hypothetical protein